MTANIWQKLNKPFFVLAPMEDITDTTFRQIVAKCGCPDLFFTEFASTAGIDSEGRNVVAKRFKFSPEEKPLIAQIWGNDPAQFYKSARYLSKNFDFDGIDINMGCPVKDVVKKGACSALIKNPELAKEIIAATKKGAGNLPVSVKTRIGFSTVVTEEWVKNLLEQDIAALTIHGRTRKQNYGGTADWNEIGKVVKLRNEMNKDTIIIGNGDIKSREQGLTMIENYGVDGVMIGRGIFNNPWLFNANRKLDDITIEEKFQSLIEHVKLFQQTYAGEKSFHIMRKYFKMYINGFSGAKETRIKLMAAENAEEVIQIALRFLGENKSEIKAEPMLQVC